MPLVLLRLTNPFLALLDAFEHHHHVGYAVIAPKLLLGPLSIRGLTCTRAEGRTFLIIVMTVAHIIHATVGLAVLAKLLGVRLLWDSIS